LLAHFKSIEDIKNASVDKLMEVPGITEQNAKAIKEYFG
jgi:excinuclease ABC subunit C